MTFLGRVKRKILRTLGLLPAQSINAAATDKMIRRIARLGASQEDLDRLIASNVSDGVADYNVFMRNLVGVSAMHQTFPYGMSFAYDSKHGKPVENAAFHQIVELAKNCYDSVVDEGVPGALVEFGVAQS